MTRYLIGGYGPDMQGRGLGMSWGLSHDDGRFEVGALAAELDSPSWVTVHGDRVFATLEGAGALVELALGEQHLTPVARHAVGNDPCHVAVAGDLPVVACYGDGTVWTAVGVLESSAPRGPRPAQDGPHAHHVLVLGDGRVLTLDLGTDRLYVHRVADGALVRVDAVPFPPGTAPRDALELPDGRVAVLGEWSCELLVLEPSGGTFEAVQILPVPGATPGQDQAAALGLSADRRFLFAGIRGADRVATLALGADSVSPVGWAPSGGRWPRHLVVDGDLVHVANQLSESIATLRVGADGTLEPAGEPVAAPSPTCLAPVGAVSNS